jgi:hypothetical protein
VEEVRIPLRNRRREKQSANEGENDGRDRETEFETPSWVDGEVESTTLFGKKNGSCHSGEEKKDRRRPAPVSTKSVLLFTVDTTFVVVKEQVREKDPQNTYVSRHSHRRRESHPTYKRGRGMEQ